MCEDSISAIATATSDDVAIVAIETRVGVGIVWVQTLIRLDLSPPKYYAELHFVLVHREDALVRHLGPKVSSPTNFDCRQSHPEYYFVYRHSLVEIAKVTESEETSRHCECLRGWFSSTTSLPDASSLVLPLEP